MATPGKPQPPACDHRAAPAASDTAPVAAGVWAPPRC